LGIADTRRRGHEKLAAARTGAIDRAQQPGQLTAGCRVRFDPGEAGTQVQIVVAQSEARTTRRHGAPAYADLRLPDAGFQLLALYRFWNIIEYWFPYRDLLDEDWDRVLIEFVPRLALAFDASDTGCSPANSRGSSTRILPVAWDGAVSTVPIKAADRRRRIAPGETAARRRGDCERPGYTR
jgi:hypothetical protein